MIRTIALAAGLALAAPAAAQQGLGGAHPEFAAFLAAEAGNLATDLGAAAKVTDEVRFVSPRYASVLRVVRIDDGGAPVFLLEPLTWRAGEGPVDLGAFFPDDLTGLKGVEAISRAVREGLKAQLGLDVIADRQALLMATVPDAIVLSNFTVAPGAGGRAAGLDFHFDSADLGLAPGRRLEVKVPAQVFGAFLKPSEAAFFSG